jgi:hypothetical protein
MNNRNCDLYPKIGFTLGRQNLSRLVGRQGANHPRSCSGDLVEGYDGHRVSKPVRPPAPKRKPEPTVFERHSLPEFLALRSPLLAVTGFFELTISVGSISRMP